MRFLSFSSASFKRDMNYILAIDQGTHASRAILFDEAGKIVATEQQEIELIRHADGRIEHDAEALLRSVLSVVDDVLVQLPPDQQKAVIAAGLTTQRSSVVACDPAGKALSPVLSWQDVRGAEQVRQLKPYREEIVSISGLPLSPHYGASKMRWLQQGIAGDNRLLAPLVSYLLMHLLDGKRFCVDYSNAQRTQLFDLQQLNWSGRLRKLFQLGQAHLPECLPMRTDYGHLKGSGIPLKAVCGDQNAAALSGGLLPANTAFLNLGSGAFLLCAKASSDSRYPLLTGVGYADDKRVEYVQEGTVNGAGNAFSWAEQILGLPSNWQQSLPGWLETVHNPPVFINSVGGIGSPWWRTDIEPHFIGNTLPDHARQTVAIAESIVFLLKSNLDCMQQTTPITTLKVSGGLSDLDGLCQKLADLCRCKVERIVTREATARGVAWLAAGCPSSWRSVTEAVFLPRQNEGLGRRFRVFVDYLVKTP